MAWLEFPIGKLLVITAIAVVGVFLAGVVTRMLVGEGYSYAAYERRGHANSYAFGITFLLVIDACVLLNVIKPTDPGATGGANTCSWAWPWCLRST